MIVLTRIITASKKIITKKTYANLSIRTSKKAKIILRVNYKTLNQICMFLIKLTKQRMFLNFHLSAKFNKTKAIELLQILNKV